MNEDGTPITPVENPVAPVTETPADATDYSNPNDLDFEMTQEQEQAYVDQILKDGNYTPPVEDKPAEKVEEEPVETVAPVVETPKDGDPETPQVTEITAPESDDLWIEVERVVTDDLGEETTETIKLTYDPSDPSSFIPEDFTAKSTKQLADIMEAKQEMAELYKGRQADFDKDQATKSAAQNEKDIEAGWNTEIKDLIDAGVLEAPKLKPSDDGFDKDPANVKTDAVFQFMADKNEERVKNGIAPIAAFGLAYTMFESSEAKIAADAAAKKEDENTKTAGALVGGGSAASGGTADQAAYKSGSHNNIWSVPVED